MIQNKALQVCGVVRRACGSTKKWVTNVGRGFRRLPHVIALVLASAALGNAARAQSTLFDFNSGPQFTSLPLDLTVGGITAHFSATGSGFSIQNPVSSIGLMPAGFSGLCLSPNSVFQADLLVSFPGEVATSFSIMYAPQELAADTSARMRVTAYMDGNFVGTSTMIANPPGTWPSATLAISAAQGFNSVVVHYDAPPVAGENYGPIFVADNMNVTASIVPEPATWGVLTMSMLGMLGFMRLRSGRLRAR